MTPSLGILSAACRFPAESRSVREVFAEEGLAWSDECAARLGIERIPVALGERGSELALAAAREALDRAGVAAKDLDALVDCTALPQEYLVPAWSMSNKLQHQLGARNAFTIGFSGGGASTFHVGLNFATCLAASDPRIRYVLLLAADLAIPGNRVIPREDPVTVLGDGASAMLLGRDPAGDVVLGTEVWSDGEFHDVYYVPGGAMAHPDRRDLFRLRLDVAAQRRAPLAATVRRLAERLLTCHGLRAGEIAAYLGPNLSRNDRAELLAALGGSDGQFGPDNLASHGHLHATDFVLNYLSLVANGDLRSGDHVLVGSHGFGFTAGVSLWRH